MIHFFKKYVLLSIICIFSSSYAHFPHWYPFTLQLTYSSIPDLSSTLSQEFDRILVPSRCTKSRRIAIKKLKEERIPQILQELEYEHAYQPFKDTTYLMHYSYDLVRAACLDFFAECVYNRCTHLLLKNLPCNPDFMAPEDIRTGVVRYLYDVACTTLASSEQASLKELMQNLDNEIAYAVRLAIRFGSPLPAVHW